LIFNEKPRALEAGLRFSNEPLASDFGGFVAGHFHAEQTSTIFGVVQAIVFSYGVKFIYGDGAAITLGDK
jgi:hypothetical protein